MVRVFVLERDFRRTAFTASGDALPSTTTALDACAVVSTKSRSSAVLATKYNAVPSKTNRDSWISFCCAFQSDMEGSSKMDERRNNAAATAFIVRAYKTVLLIFPVGCLKSSSVNWISNQIKVTTYNRQ